MKKVLFLTLLTCSNINAFAEDNLKLLSEYAVYVEQDLRVKCSDILGNVAVGSDAKIDHFLINSNDTNSKRCPLSAKGSVIFSDGSISKGNTITTSKGNVMPGQTPACIEASYTYTSRVSHYSKGHFEKSNFDALKSGSEELSQELNKALTDSNFQVIEFNKDMLISRASGHKELHIDNSGKPLILVSYETEIHLNYTGLFFSNESHLQPSQIFWYFPNATYLTIFKSGISSNNSHAKSLGIPGQIIAPNAHVNISEGLITGAIYARRLTGGSFKRDSYAECDLSSGQINYQAFDHNVFPYSEDEDQVQEVPDQDQEVPEQDQYVRRRWWCRGKLCK